jgi:hypothetical protein
MVARRIDLEKSLSQPKPVDAGSAKPEAESRAARIARVAYQRAQQRGFSPGAELEDWLAAEREIDGQISSG